MGEYAWWFGAGGWRERQPVADAPLERTVLLADGDPGASMVRRWLGGVPRLMLLPRPPAAPLPGVAYHTFRPGTNPLDWDDGTEDSLRGLSIDTLVTRAELLCGQTLVRLPRLGVRRLVLLGGERPCVTTPRRLALRRLLARGWRALRPLTEACWSSRPRAGPQGGATACA
jgi:hypothetical protein